MSFKPILITNGEPNSIFLEIFLKAYNKKKFRSPIILISSYDLLKFNMKKLNLKFKIRKLKPKDLLNKKLDNSSINLIDIKYKFENKFQKISKKSNKFIEKSFNVSFKIIKQGITDKFINGPISKKSFLNKKYPGITEYVGKKFGVNKIAMLIYNKNLSVCPLTTHIPIKNVAKKINSKSIHEKVDLITSFFKKTRGINPKIGIVGLNPHCESTDKSNEDDKIIKPCIKKLAKYDYRVSGPYPSDTIFLKKNREKFDVILGMYHDQVLTPIKTLYEYNAINITLGLPFIRISPDHGPNEKMVGKNLSNPLSLIQAINFLDKN